jgi:hypothetical protein
VKKERRGYSFLDRRDRGIGGRSSSRDEEGTHPSSIIASSITAIDEEIPPLPSWSSSSSVVFIAT